MQHEAEKPMREMARTFNAIEACHDQLLDMVLKHRGYWRALCASSGLPYTRLRRWACGEVKYLGPTEMRAVFSSVELLTQHLPKEDPNVTEKRRRRRAVALPPLAGGVVLE